MKYARVLILLTSTAIAVLVFAGSASATKLTDFFGGTYGVGTQIHAQADGNISLDGTVKVTCEKATFGGEVTVAGSSTTTVDVDLRGSMTFENCGTGTVFVVQRGTLKIHTEIEKISTDPNGQETLWSLENGDGTVTSTGLEITSLTHNILGTVHCIYKTNSTDLGVLTGSENVVSGIDHLGEFEVETLGGTPTLDLSGAIPEVATDTFACKDDATLTGSYRFTSPDYMNID